MTSNNAYVCPTCGGDDLKTTENGLVCSAGHSFPFFPKTEIPVFASDSENRNEFTITNAAEIHDNALKWLFTTFNVDEAKLRKDMLSKLGISKGQRILITSAGAGNDLPYLAEMVGKEGTIYAQDFASQMLMSAVDRVHGSYNLGDYDIRFSVSDATNLPFPNDFFDAAYHFGGLNLFSDINRGILEMDRVVKPGGRVVMGDEGIAPWLKDTDYGKWTINNNALYLCEAPLKLIPATARDVNLSWVIGNCFYLIDYTVSRELPYIDIDVKHVGRRGGSIKTRYFGKLEGIDPDLKDQLYAEAQKRGTSSVDLLESFIKKGLSDQ